jgi:hypothetical protein
MMKNKIHIALVILLFVNLLSISSYAFESGDFHIDSVGSSYENGNLNVKITMTAPDMTSAIGDSSTFKAMFKVYVDETELTTTAYKDDENGGGYAVVSRPPFLGGDLAYWFISLQGHTGGDKSLQLTVPMNLENGTHSITVKCADVQNGSVYNWLSIGTDANGNNISLPSDKEILYQCDFTVGSVNEEPPSLIITNHVGDTANITSSVSDGTATLNVDCDKACVVAYTTDDGETYTRVNATKADSGYDFVVPGYTDAMKFVVAVKGDVSGDGAIDSDDYGPLVAKYLETGTLNSLQSLIGDINADGVIDSDDYGPLVAAYLETGTISW